MHYSYGTSDFAVLSSNLWVGLLYGINKQRNDHPDFVTANVND